MDMNDNLSAEERRVARRCHINMPASLRSADGQEHRGTLRNISQTGCLFDTASGVQLEQGRHYSLRIEGLEMQVVCAAWSNEGLAGLELVNPLHASVVEDLVKKALMALARNARQDRPRLENLPSEGNRLRRPY